MGQKDSGLWTLKIVPFPAHRDNYFMSVFYEILHMLLSPGNAIKDKCQGSTNRFKTEELAITLKGNKMSFCNLI